MGMKSWPALIVAPLLALGCQAVMYALVTPSCSLQTRVLIHAVAAGSLLAVIVLTLLALREWQQSTGVLPPIGSDAPHNTRRFLAAAATAMGALSSLVILVMWMGVWVLSPCLL